MSFAGLKKTLNKANQYVSEKMGAAEGTKFTEEYHQMEKLTDITIDLVEDLISKTKEYLQPNPANRAKLTLSAKVQPSRGRPYNQPEGMLGESMTKFGHRFGEENAFAKCLIEVGEALKQMAEVKFALEDNVKQNFLEPLNLLQTKDIRDVQHHRKKLESRRLDFDCQRRRKQGKSHTPEEDIKIAEEKFEESFNLASMGMHNLLQNEPEQISQLAALSEALFEYHSQCASIMESLSARLMEQKQSIASEPLKPYVPKKLEELQLPGLHSDEISSSDSAHYNVTSNTFSKNVSPTPGRSPTTSPTKPNTLFLGTTNTNDGISKSPNASPLPSPVRSPARTPVSGPCCQALYDFEAENPNELDFKEGDIITLNSKLDENWFNGTVNGKTGIFPISYVQVLVPIGK